MWDVGVTAELDPGPFQLLDKMDKAQHGMAPLTAQHCHSLPNLVSS